MTLVVKPNYQYIWASGGAIVAPNSTKIQQGWIPEIPPHQWENWIQNRQDQFIAHINQRGIPAWDATTEYEAGGLSYVQGSDGKIYKSVAASGPATTTQDPTTDVSDTYWTIAFADVGAFLTQAAGDARYLQILNNGSDINNASTFRTNVGLQYASNAETLTGTATNRVLSPSNVSANYIQKFIFVAVDEKAAATAGGNNAIGDNIRTLNTVRTNTITGASLSSNQITLPAGTYWVEASVPFFNGDRHRGFLYNVTDAAVAILGTSENSGGAFTTRSFVKGFVTIASTKVFELRQYCENIGTNGFGDIAGDSRTNVYAEISIRREGA